MSSAGVVVDERIEVGRLGTGRAAAIVVEIAETGGCSVLAVGPNRFHIVRSYRPRWVLPSAIVGSLACGLGLLLLVLVKRKELGVVTVAEERSGTFVSLSGTLEIELCSALRHALEAEARTGATDRANVRPVLDRSNFEVPSTSPRDLSLPPQTPSSAAAEIVTAVPGTGLQGVVRPESAARSIVLLFSSGRRALVDHGGVVGRNPAQGDTATPIERISIDDPMLSKSHLEYRGWSGGVEICDLHSTNGTVATTSSGQSSLAPGIWKRLVPGDRFSMGGETVEVLET